MVGIFTRAHPIRIDQRVMIFNLDQLDRAASQFVASNGRSIPPRVSHQRCVLVSWQKRTGCGGGLVDHSKSVRDVAGRIHVQVSSDYPNEDYAINSLNFVEVYHACRWLWEMPLAHQIAIM
jgi:hypothetical protein